MKHKLYKYGAIVDFQTLVYELEKSSGNKYRAYGLQIENHRIRAIYHIKDVYANIHMYSCARPFNTNNPFRQVRTITPNFNTTPVVNPGLYQNIDLG